MYEIDSRLMVLSQIMLYNVEKRFCTVSCKLLFEK